jgi:hypothetical protein
VFLQLVGSSALAECKALLGPGGSGGLNALWHEALEHAAGMLQQTATSDRYVSRAAPGLNLRMCSTGWC